MINRKTILKMTFRINLVRSLFTFNHRFPITASVSLNLQKPTRCFSIYNKLCRKMFMEHENKYAYDIMRKRGYVLDIETAKKTSCMNNDSLSKFLQENWTKKQPSEIFEAFTELSTYCSQTNICISNTMFDNFIDDLTDTIQKATENELISLFYALNIWPETESIRTRNFIEVWAALDDVCLQRVNNWSSTQTLSFISLFYMINASKVSEFCRKGLNKLATKAKTLTPEQIVQTMFFIGIQRQSPHDIHNLQISLGNHFSHFTIDELAILSMGFFKSKTPIRSVDLVKKIINRIMTEATTIHEVSLAALLKVVRYSMRLPFDDCVAMIYELLDVLNHEVPRLSVMCNVHIALLGTSKLLLHKECLDAIANVCLEKISKARLKDLERLVLTYGTLNHMPQEDFINKVIEELRKPDRHLEIQKHSRTFACCVSYLGLLEKFPTDLINKVLSHDFLENAYGKSTYAYGKEILFLNNVVEIFFKEQKINRLTPNHTKILAKKYTDYMPKKEYKKEYNIMEKMILEIMEILEKSRGYDYLIGEHILSHHQRGDIILCNSPDGTPLPVSMEKFCDFGLVRRPPDDNKWIVLVIAGRNGTLHGTKEATGPLQVKLRELRHLGYHTNLVLWGVYSNFKTIEEKLEYLNKLINEAKK